MATDDFASLFEAAPQAGAGRTTPRLEVGQKVEGTVLAVTGGLVVVDIGGSADATLELSEFADRPVKVGDRISASVAEARKDGPRLTLALGKGGAPVSTDLLQRAVEGGTPVSGTVTAAIKGGFSVDVAGTRAFCPISQIDLGYVTEPEGYVGSSFEFQVLEFKEGGRNVVVSRKKLLEQQRRDNQEQLAKDLRVGSLAKGSVKSIIKSGVIVDLGGFDGYIHISELSRARVGTPEDIVTVGEEIEAQVLSIEQSDRGISVRLSLKALESVADKPGPQADDVLMAKVVRHVGSGLIVATSHGEGLVPTRELSLPPGADHRRMYPVDRELEVVLVSRDAQTGKLRFSVDRVQHVQERRNLKEFGSQSGSGSLGSLGELMSQKLRGLAATTPAVGTPPAGGPAAEKASPRPKSVPPLGVTRRKR